MLDLDELTLLALMILEGLEAGKGSTTRNHLMAKGGLVIGLVVVLVVRLLVGILRFTW